MLFHQKSLFVLFIILCFSNTLLAQNDSADKKNRLQYPAGLRNANYGVSIGYIHYNFTDNQLEQGFKVASVQVPHIALRVNLIGYKINNNLKINGHYMRPLGWVEYKSINGDNKTHTVWMNIAGVTLQQQFHLQKGLSIYGEAGLGIITRKGFKINNTWVVKDAGYSTGFFETGLRLKTSHKTDLIASTSYSPANKKVKQPATYFHSVGFTNNMRPFTNAMLQEKKKYHYTFPKNTIQVGVATNSLGYGINNFASTKSPVPFFWGGDVEIKNGVALHYHRNIFHTKKLFSFDWAVGIGLWKTRQLEESFFTISAFPILRFNLVHTKLADGYFYYSVAGPTFMSKSTLDNQVTGKKFTFHDMMGIGSFIGKNRKFNAEVNISHFSNGNVYSNNLGLKIPLTFCVGYTF
jgi:hypothetical protein